MVATLIDDVVSALEAGAGAFELQAPMAAAEAAVARVQDREGVQLMRRIEFLLRQSSSPTCFEHLRSPAEPIPPIAPDDLEALRALAARLRTLEAHTHDD